MQYIRSLDGIRGVAVLLVMLFHYGYFPFGWVGVQLFFTLSGYLITSILLTNAQLPFSTYIGQFYWRRSLRILPVVFGFMAVSAACYLFIGKPASFPSDWPWIVSFLGNFARMRSEDLGPSFVHLWSLAIEEQFYLVWPLLLYFQSPQSFRLTVTAILFLSPLIRYLIFQYFLPGSDATHAGIMTYVFPISQFDAFAAGAVIALWKLHERRSIGKYFVAVLALTAIAGLAVLLYAHLSGGGASFGSLGYAHLLTRAYEYVWGYSLLNVLFLLGIACAVRGIYPFTIFGNGVLTAAGKVSYGAYVYHLPLLTFMEYLLARQGIAPTGAARAGVFFVWLLTVFLVSAASYRWFEAPFLRQKDRFPRLKARRAV